MHHTHGIQKNVSAGLFLVRLAVGIIFVFHGIGKLSDMAGTMQFFDSVLPGGAGIAAIIAWIVALIETVGGVLMIAGVFTRIVGWLLALVMIGAMIFVKSGMPFVAGEIDLLLLASCLGIVLAGSGKWSFCHSCRRFMSRCACCSTCNAGACDQCDDCKDGCTGHEVK